MLKYNKSYDGEPFEEYVQYLHTIELPHQLFQLASDPKRHDFSDYSLHDSRIKKINIEKENDFLNIFVVLIGENRIFHLHFTNVRYYDISQMNGDLYSDLMTFEIAKVNGLLFFFALFSTGVGKIKILSENLDFNEVEF